jgi:uncharacterized protein YjbI with pentapeptide repeats
MTSKLRSWWQKTSKTLDAVIIISLVILLVLLVLIILGYTNNWPWTGLRGKTLYDWLQLLIIPAVLALGGYLFNYTTSRNEQKATQLRAQTEREAAEKQAQAELEAAEKRAQTERDIALDNQREQALQTYIDSMSELLLEKKLRESKLEDDEVRNIARVRTLTVLPRLDKDRKARVLQFLYESKLIDKDKKIIDLSKADLREANLFGAYLDAADLSKADLSGADLGAAILNAANLRIADLSSANLVGAVLNAANLSSANLSKANLRFASLKGAKLFGDGPIIGGANKSETDLSEADLSRAELTGANVTDKQLDKAKSLKGATMPDGTKHD